ncbi:MAG TPA: hypothetical protein PKJ47_03445 [Candidatus Limiplasma sp.]|nr:hypothetical protein [Candidatus Limiplasma sp.]
MARQNFASKESETDPEFHIMEHQGARTNKYAMIGSGSFFFGILCRLAWMHGIFWLTSVPKRW